jgi:membrane-associated phospholipid phosphatase
MRAGGLVAIACAGVALPARPDVLEAGPTDKVALSTADVAVIAAGVLGSFGPELFRNQLGPKNCRWCGITGVDGWFHDRLTGALFSRSTSNTLSSVTAYVFMPAAALAGAFAATGPYASSGAGFRAAVIIAESVAVSTAFTQSMKFLSARQRPFLHYGHPAGPGESGSYDPTTFDANLGFPSGHTSIAASLGTSAAMISTLEESPAAPWLWAAAGLLTVSTATLRMMAEEHYFTDVFAGAALGAGCGVVIPLLHQRGGVLGGSGSTAPSVSAGGGRMSFSLSGTF